MTFGEKIKMLRTANGLTLEQVGDIVGVGKSTVRKWETGMIANMRRDKIAKLADALGVTPGYLMGWEEDTTLVQGPHAVAMPVQRIPILGDTAAGAPIYADEQYDDFIEIPTDGREYDAAVRVQGDSMEPQFSIGDLALIRYQDDVEDGQIAVVGLDDEVTLKRVFHIKGALQLQSDNPRYPAIIAKYGDYNSVRIIGRVIGAIRFGIH